MERRTGKDLGVCFVERIGCVDHSSKNSENMARFCAEVAFSMQANP